jgi:DDE superfamily endonuclease
MDEAGLFYKATPDIGLATIGQLGTKKQKERIITVYCSNADGSHIVPLWIIRRAKNPRCFGTQRSNLRGLNFA